jgi:heme-degrading monooxygenase HmoA
MIAVLFEATPHAGRRDAYFDMARTLLPLLDGIDGFISIERYQSLADPSRLLSLSFWRDEAAVAAWRNLAEHRGAQAAGRQDVFAAYRLRVAEVVRDYGMHDRSGVPADSRLRHGE